MIIVKNSLLSLCLILIFASLGFSQETFKAKVVGVFSGDGLTVQTKDNRQLMFQLAGLEPLEKGQDFEQTARLSLSDKLLNQTVTVSNLKKDCHDRQTASVTFKDKDLSLMEVQSGNAWADSSCQTNESLVKEQSAAKEKKVGLWQNPNPIKPADFRKTKEQQPEVAQGPVRRLYTGLAPTPPPIMTPAGKPSGLYIGMTYDSFVDICGSGEKSSTSIGQYSKGFWITIPKTKEAINKGCAGDFHFDGENKSSELKTSSVSGFTLSQASQDQ